MNGGTAVDAGGDVAAGGRPFGRLAIVNRGEPAMRLINAVREWNAEGRPPLRTIALYTAADRRAMFVREADEAVLIGPDTDGGAGAPNPYLDLPELARALRACRAEAVWPGWGFVSERAEFAQLCRDLGIVFVGPSPEVMRALGDKIESKLLAAQVGVPMAAWSGGPVADVAAARAHAEEIGYPLMVKATAGGGGRGIRLVSRPEELDEAFSARCRRGRAHRGRRHGLPRARAARRAPRRGAGRRRRHGRRVDAGRARLQRAAAQPEGARGVGVRRARRRAGASCCARPPPGWPARRATSTPAPSSSSTSRDDRLLSFLEVNTRLQVEHPVTEATTGVDIVKLQLHVAMGGRLAEIAPAAPPAHGHAIEARLTAEDPEHGFAPAPGVIEHLVLPGGPGVRVDTGVAAGDAIPPQFDSMIAKVIAWGRDRDEARGRLARALRQTAVVIDGGTTNKAFLLDLLDRPEVRTGEVDTGWLDRLMAEGYRPPHRLDVALLAAAVEAQDEHAARQREQLFASAERGRPEVGYETWHQIDVRAGGEAYRLRVAQTRGNRYRVELDGRAGGRQRRAHRPLRAAPDRSAGTTFAVLVAPQGADYLVEVDGAVHRISGGEAGLVRAPAPAMVVAIPVAAGDTVAAGDAVAVVESMKLETALRAPFAGRVREVLVAVEHAGRGRHEAAAPGTRRRRRAGRGGRRGPGRAGRAGRRVDGGGRHAHVTVGRRSGRARCAALARARLRRRRARAARCCAGPCPRPAAALPADDPDVLAGEIAIMQIFADLSALSRNRRGPEVEEAQPDGDPGGDSAERRATRRSTCTLTCARATPTPRGCPSRSAPGCAPRSPTTACADLDAPDDQALGRRAVPDVPRPPAGPRARAGGARPAAVAARARGRARRAPPEVREEYLRTARPPGHRDPGAPPGRRRPGPAGALPLLRRAADRRRSGPAASRRCAPSWTGWPHTDPADRAAIDRRHRRRRRADPGGVRRARTTPRCSR